MMITQAMPYSMMRLEAGEDPKFMTDLARHLTCKVKKFNPFGPLSIMPVCLLETKDGTIYRVRTGLLPRVRTFATLHGIAMNEMDMRVLPKSLELTAMESLRDYQQDAVEAAMQHDMGVINAATGTGKTHMGAALIARRNVSTLFCVHTLDLLKQTTKQFRELLGVSVGVIGGGQCDVQPITVATVQTLHNMVADGSASQMSFDMIIVDECHHLPATTFYDVTGAIKHYYAYGLTATCYRKDGADMMIEAGAGPIIYKYDADAAIDQDMLCGADAYIIPIMAEMSTSDAPRHAIVNKYMVHYEPRNLAIANQVKYWVGKGKSVLIAVEWVKHGDLLAQIIPDAAIMTGSDDSATRTQRLQDLSNKKITTLISTLMKEGVDVPSLDVVINAAGGTDPMQLIGRALRKHASKDRAIYIDFVDNQHKRLYNNSLARIKKLKKVKGFNVMIGEPNA